MSIKQIALIFMFAFMTTAYAAETQPSSNVPPEQQKQIESVVHNYLVKNPEVIVESLQTMQQKQIEETRKQVESIQANAPQYADALFHQTNNPVAGNPNGKVTIVDFFDYQCPHCISMSPVIESVIKDNPNVRVVFKEFPIRGAVSDSAARAALAANLQGKYLAFHRAVMQIAAKQELTEDLIWQAAQTAGLNVEQLKKDMKSPTIAAQIKSNYQLAKDLKLMWTPAFFIAKSDVKNNAAKGSVVFLLGYVDAAQFKAVIQKMG